MIKIKSLPKLEEQGTALSKAIDKNKFLSRIQEQRAQNSDKKLIKL
jgi:hypothetical protein